MAGRGRPRKPTAALKLHGGYRNNEHGNRAAEPQPEGKPTKPRGMKKHAVELWDRIVPQLVSMGVAKEIDTTILRTACEMYHLYREALKVAEKFPIDKDARIAVTSYFAAFERAATKLGISPVDRTRVKADVKPEEDRLTAFGRKRG